jgi:homocysteine S-methyltransferase
VAPQPHAPLGDRAVGDRPVVLDGGISNALAERGHDLSDALWTARLLRDAPEEIAEVHRAYYEAGAQVATTATYQASVAGFVAAGMSRAEAEALIRLGVRLALDVRDEFAHDGALRWVAASVGPYGAVLADGSEYRGDYGVSAAALREFHLPRLI